MEQKQVKYKPELIEYFSKCKNVHRLEKLIHIELQEFKADNEKCKNCGKKHREWFKVTKSEKEAINGMHGWNEIRKIIIHWMSYIERVYGTFC